MLINITNDILLSVDVFRDKFTVMTQVISTRSPLFKRRPQWVLFLQWQLQLQLQWVDLGTEQLILNTTPGQLTVTTNSRDRPKQTQLTDTTQLQCEERYRSWTITGIVSSGQSMIKEVGNSTSLPFTLRSVPPLSHPFPFSPLPLEVGPLNTDRWSEGVL